MPDLTAEEIAELRRVTEAASPPPWMVGQGYEQSDPGTHIWSEETGLIIAAEQDNSDCVLEKVDADFMAAARNLLPRLLDEVVRRRRERDIIDAFIAGLCLRTGLEYAREWGLLEEIIANPAAGRRA